MGTRLTQLDAIASQPQYRAHLEPVLAAMAPEALGSGHSRAVIVTSAADLSQAVRRGYERVAYLEHGMGQTYGNMPGYPGGRGRQHVGLFLSPNEHAASRDREAYPGARVEVVGDPALASLPHREPGPPAVAVSFHWPCTLAPEAGTALRHYRGVLGELAVQVPLIGHGHPRAAAQLERLWTGLGVEWVPDWHEVLRRADLYVCDNSSTLYEFASTGRPVVVLNAPWYRREVEHGLRFWQAADVGVQVDHPEQLEPAVRYALTDPPEQRRLRNQALRLVYAHPHDAAERAARALEDWLQ